MTIPVRFLVSLNAASIMKDTLLLIVIVMQFTLIVVRTQQHHLIYLLIFLTDYESDTIMMTCNKFMHLSMAKI